MRVFAWQEDFADFRRPVSQPKFAERCNKCEDLSVRLFFVPVAVFVVSTGGLRRCSASPRDLLGKIHPGFHGIDEARPFRSRTRGSGLQLMATCRPRQTPAARHFSNIAPRPFVAARTPMARSVVSRSIHSHGGEFEQTLRLIGLWNRFKLRVILLGQLIA